MSTAENAVTWGVVEEHAVFGGSAQIDELRAVYRALAAAKTWGEFRQMIGPERAEDLREMMDEDDPPDSAAFSSEDIPGYGDGDWPEWLQQNMLSWVPEDVQERFGSVEASRISGDALIIYAEKGEDVAAALEAQGFTCTRDDAAVREAAGYGTV